MANPQGINQYSKGRSPRARVSSARKQYSQSPGEFGTLFRNSKNMNMSTRASIKRATVETRFINALKKHGKY